MKVFIDSLTDEEAASVIAAMKDISQHGLSHARHLKDEIYEVRADAEKRSFRILFSQETKFILLSLSAFPKKTKKTPLKELEIAQKRMLDWHTRSRN